MPRLLCTSGVIVALVLVALELKARRTVGTDDEGPHDDAVSDGNAEHHETIGMRNADGGAVAVAEPHTQTRREFVLVAMRMFAWMIAFLVLVAIGGYLAALLLFIPAFLLFVARDRRGP